MRQTINLNLHQIPLISNRNLLFAYNSSPFTPNNQVEIQEGGGGVLNEVLFLGLRGPADGLKIRIQYLGQKVFSKRQ